MSCARRVGLFGIGTQQITGYYPNHDWPCHPWPPFVYRRPWKKVAKGDNARAIVAMAAWQEHL